MKFNDYEWHDAILKKLNIDRSNPGYHDTVSIDVEWSDGTSSRIIFEDVYKAILDMNFGAVGVDYIVEAYIALDNDKDLVMLRNIWKDYEIGYIDCYIFRTTASGSEIKIMAKNFKVLKPSK